MAGLMARNRRAFNTDTRGSDRRKFFSAATHCQFAMTLPTARAQARGDLLDVGAGDVPYREYFADVVDLYHTVDYEKRIDEIDFEADAQDMSGVIESDRYDTVLLFEVLEHVPNPFKVVGELFRVLRRNGKVVLSVPHLSRLHEEPYDFYRYTKYGLRHLFEEAGFVDVEIIPRGGFFCFLTHQVSTILICLTWHIPLIKDIVFFLNKWLVVRPAYWLDTITDRGKIFALGYILIARKG
jgi:SAM-dependent methyltransferase